MTTRPSLPQVWIFPEGTTLEQGPLNFVPGSQHNSEAKLRWMHAYSLPPATEAMREPSFRLHGCPTATEAAADFVAQTEASRVAVLPLPGVARTLAIVDTSALHARGNGTAGAVRQSLRLAGDNDGGLPRLHPYRMPVLLEK